MPKKKKDIDGDGIIEPLYEPDNIDEAVEAAQEMGLEGGVHAVEIDDKTLFAPGDSPSELDMAKRML